MSDPTRNREVMKRSRAEIDEIARTIPNPYCMLCGEPKASYIGVWETGEGVPGLIEPGTDIVYRICEDCHSRGITSEKGTLIEEAIIANLRSKRAQ